LEVGVCFGGVSVWGVGVLGLEGVIALVVSVSGSVPGRVLVSPVRVVGAFEGWLFRLAGVSVKEGGV
jgi:hypothetical protein